MVRGSATLSRVPDSAEDHATVECPLDDLRQLTEAALSSFGYNGAEAATIAEVLISPMLTSLLTLTLISICLLPCQARKGTACVLRR